MTSARASQLADYKHWPNLSKLILATRPFVSWHLTDSSFHAMLEFVRENPDAITDAQLPAFLSLAMSVGATVGALEAYMKVLEQKFNGGMADVTKQIKLLAEDVLSNEQAGHDLC